MVPIAGLLGCVLLAVFMPVRSVEAGVIVSVVGVVYYVTRKMLGRNRRRPGAAITD